MAGVTLFALYTDYNLITRNRIGTDLSGQAPLGNGADGIRIAFGPKNNIIGGTEEEGNVIAHNGQKSIALELRPGDTNFVSGNRMFKNRLP